MPPIGFTQSLDRGCWNRSTKKLSRTNFANKDLTSSNNSRFRSFTKPCSWESDFEQIWVVEASIIVEVKSIVEVAPVHKKQLLTYLRLAGKSVGLLINFNVFLIKEGITRIVNG